MAVLRGSTIKKLTKYLLATFVAFLCMVFATFAFFVWVLDDDKPIYSKDLKALLIPSMWSAKQLAKVGSVDHYFVYASDGPKVAETRIIFTNLNVTEASAYLRQVGYKAEGALQWKKPDSEIFLELIGSCPVQCPARIIILGD